ncbi:hypothetical protein NE604_02150 [Anaerofustis stercorihominis]|uniref:hypothetical protein n=1 Tax=Anaerofustis stercorihominis TaxID=214853 RepID=UPI002108DC6B|nr:hypothetical protein [Anaerofustis stercorihominis]MCQ4794442.1 hypothetical protein [Anaerofustis stercorihominis]
MRKSSKKNLKIIWLVILLFGLISGGILISFAIGHKLYWVAPICPILIILMYYLSLYFKYKSYSIIYNKKGYDTTMLYIDPFYTLYRDPDKKYRGRLHNKHYFSLGVTVPKFKYPQNDEEFNKLKGDFTFTTFENIAGNLLLLVLACISVYFLFVYIFSDIILFFIDVALIFLILFTSTQILFILLEGDKCLDIPNDKIDTGEKDEEGHHIVKNSFTEEQYDYLVASKFLLYGSYNLKNRDVKRNYLLKKISDYLNKDFDLKDLDFEDMYTVDFVLRDYLDVKFGRLNVGFSKYINFLYENFDDIAVNKISSLKDDIKEYLVVCHHIIAYFIKRKDYKKANDLYDKLSDFDLDEKKDKDLIYLKKRNAALLKIEGSDINNVLIDDTIVYNGLDVFSKVTSNYLEEEKDYRYITETKSQRDKRRKEREDKLRAQGAFVEDTSEIENDNKSSKKGLFKKKNKKEVCDKENEELTLNEEKEIVSDESEISDNESLKSENIENIDKEDDLSKEDDK